MRTPAVIMVAAVLAVAGVAAWLVGSQEEKEESPLFPELTIETLNAVNRIEIVRHGKPPVNVYLADDGVWRVTERYDHPADTVKIRALLTGIENAEKIEQKTSQPEYYAMLGVVDPTSEEYKKYEAYEEAKEAEEDDENEDGNKDKDKDKSKSKLLTFKTPDEVWRLIVGKSSDQVKDGRYVRKPEEAESWLASADLPLATDPASWLDTQILHIEPDSLSTITVTPTGAGEPFTITRGGHGLFELAGLEKQSEMKNPFGLQEVASVTEHLQFRDVFPRGGDEEAALELPDEHLTAVFMADDGLVVTIRAYKADENTMYCRVEAAGESEQAQELKQRLPKWTYEIASLIYENLDKTRDSFLKDSPDDPS